ncbi:Bug family tripartite tricarboxylate transporter substrate binding protein [Roseomonas xinghualingensis]|uniref:Bug family tripartite tricarboxylate transporter substrate binding protein n=1 Tax=Roseomonas xinghualingensis TaxID=2986475 RepID=UPI0021F0E113|nr:tripartite tricarboxylate transporter substrate binding protein [Roseomonas sp. SXEYE001]MCV4206341.1 tripartite tricarboxylate transporter substrate binding protein [Roseomonas sp. SXEYE001]
MQITRRLALSTTIAAPFIRPAASQEAWPNRPVRVIVPWPPGGSTDVLCRLLCEQMQQKLGQSFVLENRPGAGGNIGADALAKAPANGYAMGPLTLGAWHINQFLYSKLPYDPQRDFQPISMHWELPNVLVVSAQHNPANNFQEFVAWAKAQRGGISYGSPGVGTTAHLSGALFVNRLGLDGTHVPFRGAAQIIPAMLAGDLTCAMDNLASYVPVIQEGRMKAFAITGAERWPTLPDVPVMAEVGVPDFVVTSWCAMAFPAGTPAPIVERAAATMREIGQDPAMQERFLRTGARCVWSTPADVTARVERERPMWQEVVRISGARLE